MNVQQLKEIANDVRKGIIISTHAAKSGHPGGSLSVVEILVYLYYEELNTSPSMIKDNNRDRFVLSKGHAAPALYSVLVRKGYFPWEDLKILRNLGSHLQGHPCLSHTPGIDMATGSLGQGISSAVGMALAAKYKKMNTRVYVLCGDGECQEGQVWEALMFAAHYKLDNLCVIIDNNNLQIDGNVNDVMNIYPLDEKLKAFNFHVETIDGHDFSSIGSAFENARSIKTKPTCIIAKTIKGKGISFMEDMACWHGKAPNDEEYKQAMLELEAGR